MTTLSIDGIRVEVAARSSVLEAARAAGIYIPTLCSHPDLPPSRGRVVADFVYRGRERIDRHPSAGGKQFDGCRLCVVEVQGTADSVPACDTEAIDGMVVLTDTARTREARQRNLVPILANHPHACLTCAQREGCSRTQCSANVPIDERCCSKLGRCELQRVAEHIGIRDDTPRYVPCKLPMVDDEPLFTRDPNLCIACTRCVRACDDMRDVRALAFTYDGGNFVVGTSGGPTLAESGCRFCTACVEVCPTGALMDKDIQLAERERQLVPCKYTCPSGIDVPRIMRLMSEGRFGEAAAVVREKVPFPLTLGSVCFHPCEDTCRRGKVNEPIAICAVKRFAAENDTGEWREMFRKAPPTGKRVAVIGAGPSGMTAGYYLRMLGHSVTVFDSHKEPGGMMGMAIPNYRLPPGVLEEDIGAIMESGLEYRGGVTIGREKSIKDLRAEGYDAIYIAVGAPLSKRIPLEGSDLEDVLWGLDFLQDVKADKAVRVRDRIMVIGGGNVAMDVALTALRLGARDIQVACLESREEMPAFEWEIQEVLDEGITIHVSWGPKRILSEGGKVKGIELKRCTSVFDEQGRFNPKFDESVTTAIDTDMVILAIGQGADPTYATGVENLNVTRGGGVIVEPSSLRCSVEGVFAGGDIVTGPKSVIEAIEMGRQAAVSIDRYLGGKGDIEIRLLEPETPNPRLGRIEGFACLKRPEMRMLEKESRRRSFDRLEIGYDEDSAVFEAGRCLRCDLRLLIESPVMPPEKWLEFNEANVAKVPDSDGVFQLLDEKKEVIKIAGTATMRSALVELLSSNKKARYFLFEEDKMYTKRETELLQQYMQRYGKMPGGGDELDELF